MKIALILSSPPGYSETFFRSKIKGLQENGHEVILVTSRTKLDFDLCEHRMHPQVYHNKLRQIFAMLWVFLTLIPFWKQAKNFYQFEKKERTSTKRIIEKIYINATLLKLKTDWLHFGFATMSLDRELVAKAIEAKMAVSFRGYDIGVYPLKNPGCYLSLWKHLDKVHYISEDLYQKALKLGLSKNIDSQKITPAINTDFFKSNKTSIKNTNLVTFLTIGRLHWKKGHLDMLKAMHLLKKNNIDFRYKIIGDGDDKERIAYMAHVYGILEQIEFLGKLNHDQVKLNLKDADIYLQYSIQEGFCNAVLEAQAMGTLCVVSDAEGLAENVLHNYSGWVVPKLKPVLLADRILEVSKLSNKEKNKITQQAQERVKNSFTLQQQKEAFKKFYSL